MIKLIVAMDKNNLIGSGNKLPWNLPKELKHFKEKTLNHALLFGKNTFLSLPPLPKRKIYVLSDENLKENVEAIKNKEELLNLFNSYKNTDEVLFIAGGKSVYEQFYMFADELIISRIKNSYEGDVFLNIDLSDYRVFKKEENDEFDVEYWAKTSN